jgi:hypothetical protein
VQRQGGLTNAGRPGDRGYDGGRTALLLPTDMDVKKLVEPVDVSTPVDE